MAEVMRGLSTTVQSQFYSKSGVSCLAITPHYFELLLQITSVIVSFRGNFSLREHPPSTRRASYVLLRQVRGLISLHQADLVCFQDSERRVVLCCCEDKGAKIALLAQEPNNDRDSHDGYHTENDQGVEQCIGL